MPAPLPIFALSPQTLPAWRRDHADLATCLGGHVFDAKLGECIILRASDGGPRAVLVGVSTPIGFYDLAAVTATMMRTLPADTLHGLTCTVPGAWSETERLNIHAGFTLGTLDKKGTTAAPVLDTPHHGAQTIVTAIRTLRDMVNAPANLFGPEELEAAARMLAHDIGANAPRVVHDEDLITQNFPLIHAVGRASARRPRLIEFTWGNPAHPRVALIGKGVCFDSGGLNIKPGNIMGTYKRDMGGAAHALGLARLVADAKLPVYLHVLIPAVENMIDGNAFRPGDVLTSRKGLTIENGSSDAEGRLILADCLSYAQEKSAPDLIMDFATLTPIRVATGTQIQAVFAQNHAHARRVQDISFDLADHIWALPLADMYEGELVSECADILSTGGGGPSTIMAALFLKQFVPAPQDWLHFDIYAWRDAAKPGRPKHGAETGLRAAFAFLQERYR